MSSVQGRNQSQLGHTGAPLMARTLIFHYRKESIDGKPAMVYDVTLPANMPLPCNIHVESPLYFDGHGKTQSILLLDANKKRGTS